MDGLGSVEILVPGDRADEARDLLQQADSGAFSLVADQDPPP
jgi:hypothetical protein